jgi:DNA-binding GntR family transcriptional regulator
MIAHAPSTEIPRYQEIVSILLKEIDGGAYRVGDRMPTEFDLCARFDVSRHTVREALRKLEDMGLISRRPGAGTVLAATTPDSRYVNSISSLDELMQYASATRLEVLRSEPIKADEGLAALLDCEPGTPWVRVDAQRWAADTRMPFCLTILYVRGEFADIVPKVGREQVAVYRMIEESHGVTVREVTQDIEGVVLDADTIAALGVPSGSAGLRITRLYLGADGQVFEGAINIHPADRFRYSMRLQRQSDPPSGRKGTRS